MVGCAAVADERRLNTLENLLCLPVSKRNSFVVKFAVALVLGIVLGGIIPWVLLRLGDLRPWELEFQQAVGIAALITGIAFYASTMSRGLLQALPTIACIPAIMGIAFILWLTNSFFPRASTWRIPFCRSLLFPAMTWPAMMITFLWLAFQNYKQLQIGWRMWLGNLTRAGAVFGCVTLASIAIFDRSWELFLPLEPRHGPAAISGAGRAGMGIMHSNLCVLLPDGRLWIGEENWTGKKNERRLKDVSGGFDNGSNWVKLATSYTSAVAIKSDGTLWKILNRSNISQIGSESDWKTIAANGSAFLAVKQNGTLWGWGYNRNEILRKKPNPEDREDKIAEPMRIGDETDWVDAFLPSYEQAMGVKRDGSVRKWGNLLVKNPEEADGRSY